ncbi:MAG TPA: helicase C-terminal domain-containing protein [Dehalococcoidia bacterium]|nr:helicase C-terminal domain-containing protein [Dehalococcoidia bacterium]
MDQASIFDHTVDRIFVALDLETTGLDPSRDAIIEIGAVKFQDDQVIDTFQTFVNPGRNIPEFIQRLTGISPNQVKRAPTFNAVMDDLESFLEGHPIVGHNISFDLRFLDSHGLTLANPSHDTWDLASVFLPTTTEYSLRYLANLLGAEHTNPHRALDDAQATREVFVSLLRRASELDPGLLAHITNLSNRSRWALASLLGEVSGKKGNGKGPSAFGLTGLNLEYLSTRLGRPQRRRFDPDLAHLDEKKITSLMEANGPFAKAFAGFEHRPEQLEMLAKVTEAIYQGRHLVVEGGTGVGKSMAYLLPAAIFAAAKGQRVVISTNTINLQEQLMRKDIPAVIGVLEGAGLVKEGLIQAALLKGRGNYLCLHRWGYLARSENPSVDDARLLGKTAVWLQDTTSGDRSEINLSGRDAFTWSKVSAGDRGWCPGLRDGGPCFLRSAREKADQAHIVVVNHALLLSDLMHGGSLIPDYQYLIIDEAHNLEEEATKQFGFEITPERLQDELEPLSRLTTQVRIALSTEDLASVVRQNGDRSVADIESLVPHLRELWGRLWGETERFLETQRSGGGADNSQLLITKPMRNQKYWADLTLAWENLDVTLGQAVDRIAQVQRFLDGANLPAAGDSDTLATLTMESANIQDAFSQLREQMSYLIGSADEQRIIWIARDQYNNHDVSLHAAPLQVSTALEEQLFSRKESVVLTSATLSTQGTFVYIRGRLGLGEETGELLVGSPFDYQKAALLMIPDDMPQPNSDRYIESMSRVMVELGRCLSGHTMALFTSYSALRSVAQPIRATLLAQGIEVLAQGVDGSPQQLTRRFIENPQAVLLGTSSFWEGVDFPSGVLKALVLTRLPFQVPSDPIVRARSDQYQDAFKEYSIPQAVLRFRQGIGRLIRNKGDKGAIVVLDRRITGRSYGQAFLNSIPPCSLKPSSLATVGTLAAEWIGENRGSNH